MKTHLQQTIEFSRRQLAELKNYRERLAECLKETDEQIVRYEQELQTIIDGQMKKS